MNKMQKIYKLLFLLIVVPLGFASCSEDDKIKPEEDKPVVNIPELALDVKSVELEVDKTSTVQIKTGGGDYGVFSSNPDIVTAELTDNAMNITAHKRGVVSLIVSDKNEQYSEVMVSTYYNLIELSTKKIEVEIPLGHSKTFRFPILKGNGSYEVVENSDILEASIDSDELILKVTAAGEASIELSDVRGVKHSVPVVVKTTTNPYTQKELKEIMENDRFKHMFNGRNIIISMYKDHYRCLNSKEADKNLYGWELFGMQYLKFYFSGDYKVGKKADTKMVAKLSWRGMPSEELVDFEIIKNDGTKIWAVYSYVKDNKLNYGHFCQNIEP